MATILNTNTGLQAILMTYHTLGRHRNSNNTVLLNADASRIHAAIHWDGEHWQLIGKGTNGTYINGKRVTEESNSCLKKGDSLHFGSIQSDMWEVLDDGPPESMLVPITPDLKVIKLTGVVVLPSEESPHVSLYLSSEGQWVCESESGTNLLKSGDLVGAENKFWRFVDAEPSISTQALDENIQMSATEVDFYFNVSQNEEHVSLKLKVDQQTIDLEERSHHYPLLLLARQRLEDKTKVMSRSEQGWIDKDIFSDMLGLSDNHINILIYRFRKQCLASMPQFKSLNQIIERRVGELRLNCDDIKIEGGLQNFNSLV